MTQTTVNRRAYDYASIKAILGGIPFTKISSITYSVVQAKENQYGLGIEPTSIGHGTKEYTGSLEVQFGDIEEMRLFSPTGSLVDIPAFDIILAFGNNGIIKNHVLVGAEFTNDEVTGTTGDMSLKATLNLVIGSIKFKP